MKRIITLALTTAMVTSLPTSALAAGLRGNCNTPVSTSTSIRNLSTSAKFSELCNKLNNNCDTNLQNSLNKNCNIAGLIIGGNNCGIINKPSIPVLPEAPETPQTPSPDVETPEVETPENENNQGSSSQTAQEAQLAAQVLELVNAERASAGLSPLKLNVNLQEAAQTRSKELTSSFSHTRPDGSSFSTAIKQQNVTYTSAGENIAYGQKTAQAVMNGWMNSSGHRANILNANFDELGVGVYIADNGTIYWTQLFVK